jgi:hypothetical protein
MDAINYWSAISNNRGQYGYPNHLVPSDTVLVFSLRVMDNHGSISTNPSVVYVTVKHNPNNIGSIGGNTPGTTVILQQQQQQPIIPNSNAISPHSQL